jgi:hypothetical protein
MIRWGFERGMVLCLGNQHEEAWRVTVVAMASDNPQNDFVRSRPSTLRFEQRLPRTQNVSRAVFSSTNPLPDHLKMVRRVSSAFHYIEYARSYLLEQKL